MKHTSRIVKRVATGALACTLLFQPTTAYAENGSITITASNTASSSYDVYRLFIADINDGSAEENSGIAHPERQNEATHVTWEPSVRDTALSFLDENGYTVWLAEKGYTQSGARENAQNAAEFISETIGSSATAAGSNTTPPTKEGTSFASELAKRVAENVSPVGTTQAGQAFIGPEGYYLFVSNAASISSDLVGTAPLWIALGGSTTSIVPKNAMPALIKQVKGVGDEDYRLSTDAFTNQDVQYRITGNLPSNFKAFTSYRYKITDEMNGMELSQEGVNGVSVTIDGDDVTADLSGEHGSITYENGILTIDFTDLATFPHAISSSSAIVITYQAHNTVVGAAGRGGTNVAHLTYTADPITNTTSTTSESSPRTHTYSYRLLLTKIDKSNKQTLEGAGFTVQVATYTEDPSLQGLFVQADGSLESSPFEFVTGADGTAAIPGLDVGTYTVAEITAPPGYETQDADMSITIVPSINEATGNLESLQGILTGGESIDVTGDEPSRIAGASADAGVICIQASDDRTFTLAHTGLEGNTALYLIAGVIGGAGAAGYVLSTRHVNRCNRRGC